MIETNIDKITEEDLQRIEALVDHAKAVYESHKYLMTNKYLPLHFEYGDVEEGMVISGISNYSAIFIRVSAVICSTNTILMQAYNYVPAEFADDEDFLRGMEDRLYMIEMAFCVLHEMAHAGQQIPVGEFIPARAITFEDSADYAACSILRQEYNASELEISLIMANSYGRRFLIDYAPPKPNLTDYYTETLKIIICIAACDSSIKAIECSASVLYYQNNLTIINRINNNNVTIPVKINGMLVPPSADYVYLLKLLLQSRRMKIIPFVEEPDEYTSIIILIGTALFQGFAEDICDFYGARTPNTDELKDGNLHFDEEKGLY